MTDEGSIKRYIDCVAEKRRLEAKIRDLEHLIEELERDVVDQMATVGVQRLTMKSPLGMATIYLATDTWARPADESALIAALDAHGMGELARRRVNIQSLSALVREIRAENGGEIPQWLAENITVSDMPRARVRFAGGGGDAE